MPVLCLRHCSRCWESCPTHKRASKWMRKGEGMDRGRVKLERTRNNLSFQGPYLLIEKTTISYPSVSCSSVHRYLLSSTLDQAQHETLTTMNKKCQMPMSVILGSRAVDSQWTNGHNNVCYNIMYVDKY